MLKEGNEYHIGLSFLGLGAYARNRTDIYDAARVEVDELADETGELVNLLVDRKGIGIYLYQAKGEQAVELDTYEGKRVHLHCTALGKAILGFRPRDEVIGILDEHGLSRMTESTITDHETLLEELDEVRERKYAIDREERLTGLRCIAAPITNEQDRSIAAISVAAPTHRVDDERFYDELPDTVLRTANVIELQYNYS